MTGPENGITRELEDLVAAACDGDLSDRQVERLEQLLLASGPARRYYLLYLHLHGELHWHEAMAGERPEKTTASAEGRGIRLPIPTISHPKPEHISRLRVIGFCVCAFVAVGLLVLAYRAMPEKKRVPSPAPRAMLTSAKLTGEVQARWAAGATPAALGQEIPLKRRLTLEQGVIEIAHGERERILVDGPSAFRYLSDDRLELESGRATLISAGSEGFQIEAGGATIESAGGTIGVAVGGSIVEVHALDGQARIRKPAPATGSLEMQEMELKAGDALIWTTGSPVAPRSFSADTGHFMLSLPNRNPNHSVAKLRAVAENHPRLIHHYTFEGTSRVEKCQDKRGALHLTETVMVNGRGRGALDYTARGLDLTTEAIGPHREPEDGNQTGVALQSEVQFRPPQAMTIELLVRYQSPADVDDETIAMAVATRDRRRDCGFYVAVVGNGHLTLLLDGEAEWVETDTVLTPGHWYYVAMTFESREETTVVNAYAVDLAGGVTKLQCLLENEEIPGVPPKGRLGIGKGFDDTGAHAYPWSGELDEVAIYDAILAAEELQTHVDVLRAGTSDLD